MEDPVSLLEYTASLCCGSCRKQGPETITVRKVFLNKIEITRGIHKGLHFLPYKNYHESLSARKIFLLRLTITQTRLIHYSKLYSSCIEPGLFALLSIAVFLPTLRLYVVSFTLEAKNLFPTALLMRRAGDRSINSLRLSRNRSCRTRTRWQRCFRLTIQVGSELLCKGNQIMFCFWYA